MAWPRVFIHCLIPIIVRTLILIQHAQPNRRAQRDAEFDAGLDLNPVFFVARRGDGGLTRPAPAHLWLNVGGFSERETWRAAVDNAANGAAMGFAITVCISDIR